MSEFLSESGSLDREHPIDEMAKHFPPGPLDSYRNRASFDWFQMKVFIDGGEDVVRFKHNVLKTMEKDPLFNRANDSKLSFDERRRLTMKRCKRVLEYNFLTDNEVMARPLLVQVFNDLLGSFDWSISTKYLLNKSVSSALYTQRGGTPMQRVLGCPSEILKRAPKYRYQPQLWVFWRLNTLEIPKPDF